MSKVWIDPPTGWVYGFPKVYDTEKDNPDVYEWIISQGYPRELAESFNNQFHYRVYPVREEL